MVRPCSWVVLVSLSAPGGVFAAEPPRAEKIPRETVVHGITLQDDYFWFRQKDDPTLGPKMLDLLRAERAYCDAAMAHTQALQDRLAAEMRDRLQPGDTSVPAREGEWLYFTRSVEGQPFQVHCRRRVPDGAEQVIIDPNVESKGRAGFGLGTIEISPDARIAAIPIDVGGGERYTVRFRDLTTDAYLPVEIADTNGQVAWAADNATVFFARADEKNRPAKVLCRSIVSPDTERLVFEEPDEAFLVDLSSSRSGAFVLINSAAKDTSECRVISTSAPDVEPRVIEPRRRGVEYAVDHQAGEFVILVNDTGANFRLIRTPQDATTSSNWREIIAHDPRTLLEKVECFRGFVAVTARTAGLPRLMVLPSGDAKKPDPPWDVTMSEPSFTLWGSKNLDFDATTYRFNYTSPITPVSTFEVDVVTHERRLLKQQQIKGFDRERYAVEVAQVRSHDGAMVPMTIAYRKDTPRNGSAAALLFGYGAYGVPVYPAFRNEQLSLLDRGFVLADAHVRGGSDKGRDWYADGKLRHKKNTFLDFIACAEHLVANKYAAPKRVAAHGGSAGGTLMGAVVTMRPDLFGAIVAYVPFVDLVNTMLDSSIAYTVNEFDEWGNPGASKEDFEYMLSYSPYENTRPAAYPPILILAGYNDPRVPYWEPAKWAQRLRENNTAKTPVLFRIDVDAGHFGAADKNKAIREEAFVKAFLLESLGVETGPRP